MMLIAGDFIPVVQLGDISVLINIHRISHIIDHGIQGCAIYMCGYEDPIKTQEKYLDVVARIANCSNVHIE